MSLDITFEAALSAWLFEGEAGLRLDLGAANNVAEVLKRELV